MVLNRVDEGIDDRIRTNHVDGGNYKTDLKMEHVKIFITPREMYKIGWGGDGNRLDDMSAEWFRITSLLQD